MSATNYVREVRETPLDGFTVVWNNGHVGGAILDNLSERSRGAVVAAAIKANMAERDRLAAYAMDHPETGLSMARSAAFIPVTFS